MPVDPLAGMLYKQMLETLPAVRNAPGAARALQAGRPQLLANESNRGLERPDSAAAALDGAVEPQVVEEAVALRAVRVRGVARLHQRGEHACHTHAHELPSASAPDGAGDWTMLMAPRAPA